MSGVTVYAQGLVSELACRLLALALDPTGISESICYMSVPQTYLYANYC